MLQVLLLNFVAKKSITFDDNERAPNWRYSKFTDLAFWPNAIDKEILLKQGFNSDNLMQYNGFKEDLYIADYTPNPSFLDLIPFKSYVVVRPENIEANYANGNSISIIPELLELFKDLKKNVLFLPRYSHDRELGLKYSHIFMPSTAINGLDACYYSEAVFTGAGTMAREAGCLGVPAFSFYTGKKMLTVDQTMIKKSWLYFSRNPNELVEKFLNTQKRKPDLERPKKVKKEILEYLETFFDKNDLK
jgi:predicted glycosyltransferase